MGAANLPQPKVVLVARRIRSVSKSLEPATIEYIRKQDEHHEQKSFEEELLELFSLHGIEYDLRYLFN